MVAFGAVLVGPQLASASPGQVIKIDVTGAVFTCTDGSTYTVTSGTAVSMFHESTDPAGGLHITGTIAPTRVTLSHSTDDLTYRLAGASWFGGNLRGAGGNFTDTEHWPTYRSPRISLQMPRAWSPSNSRRTRVPARRPRIDSRSSDRLISRR
jgi:hypothetical protein